GARFLRRARIGPNAVDADARHGPGADPGAAHRRPVAGEFRLAIGVLGSGGLRQFLVDSGWTVSAREPAARTTSATTDYHRPDDLRPSSARSAVHGLRTFRRSDLFGAACLHCRLAFRVHRAIPTAAGEIRALFWD